MSDPLHLADHAWEDAVALVSQIEHAARSNISPQSFFDDVTASLRLISGALAVSMWTSDRQERTILARNGISIHDDERIDVDQSGDLAPQSRWIDADAATGGRLLSTQRIHPDVQLGIELRFDRPVEISRREPLSELVQAVLELAATVFLRGQVSDLRSRIDEQSRRDALICKLNEGISLTDSFVSITAAIASQTSVDRVSLLRTKSSRFRLVTTSSQSKIDRRARQVRLLEQLVDQSLEHDDRLSFTVGSADQKNAESTPGLDDYLHESGCREIVIESISDEDQDGVIAAIVVERFRGSPDEARPLSTLMDPFRPLVADAVRAAIRRDDATWGLIASRFAGPTTRRTAIGLAIGLGVLVLAACFIPAMLKIPVEGRILATKRSRLYAPAEGIVAEVAVRNGQRVEKGQTLAVLRSDNLDLQQRRLEASLSTVQTRLASLLAIRSRSSTQATRERDVSASADEQVLKTELEGLEKQLRLVRQQQASLHVTSPLDGRVDRWDLQQSLTARPVTHGQHLLDVISEQQGWTIELELPEQHVNYVLDAQRLHPCRCTFRLRSNPTKTYTGIIKAVSDVAHVNPLGQSMVRLTLPLKANAADDFRTGATVIAQVECGKHPLGFVWLRGLIQWWRTQAWF